MDLVNKIACRAFAILYFFIGVFCSLMAIVVLYWVFGSGPPADLAADLEKTLGPVLSAKFQIWFGAGLGVMGIVLVMLGVFAWLRHTWALIVGSLISVWMAVNSSNGDATDATDVAANSAATITTIVLVALTIVAALTAWRSRSQRQANEKPA